jgi:Fe-S cluster assembly iron-binding protein IscA
MLAMTQQAAEVVESIVERPEVPDTAVLRITAQASNSNGSGPSHDLQLELVSAPPEDDVIVEDLPISVEPEAASLLEDKVLDAEIEGDAVRFNLYGQDDAEGPDSAA